MPSNGTNALEKDAFLQKWKSGAEFSLTSATVGVLSAYRTMIASMHFLTFNDSLLTQLHIEYKDCHIEVILQFVDDPDKKESVMIPDNSVKGRILLIFVNFNSPFSVWTQSAYPIGEIGDYPLYARAKITMPPKGFDYREVLMTFYVEDARAASKGGEKDGKE